jgi:hypothetical protein
MKSLLYFLSGIVICAGLFYLSKNGVINTGFDRKAQDQKEIKENVELGFYNLTAGVYFSNNVSPEKITFYNLDITRFAALNVMMQSMSMIAMFGGSGEKMKFSFTPSNIVVNSFNEDATQASISYDLTVVLDDETTKTHIDSDAKKIGGQWKINGNIFDTKSEENINRSKRKKH